MDQGASLAARERVGREALRVALGPSEVRADSGARAGSPAALVASQGGSRVGLLGGPGVPSLEGPGSGVALGSLAQRLAGSREDPGDSEGDRVDSPAGLLRNSVSFSLI